MIRIENLTVQFGGVKPIDGLTVTLDKAIVGLIGPNGAGKTTLLNVLSGFVSPVSGSVAVNGVVISDIPPHKRAHLGLRRTFQTDQIADDLTLWENVQAIADHAGYSTQTEARHDVQRAIDYVGLGKRMDHRPNQLSGGQKQRVAIARALIAKPRILMADEPTGNLDTTTTEEILALFAQIHAQGQTVLMVTHENDVAAHCERVVRLRDGLVLSDLPAEQDAAVGPLALARRSAA